MLSGTRIFTHVWIDSPQKRLKFPSIWVNWLVLAAIGRTGGNREDIPVERVGGVGCVDDASRDRGPGSLPGTGRTDSDAMSALPSV